MSFLYREIGVYIGDVGVLADKLMEYVVTSHLTAQRKDVLVALLVKRYATYIKGANEQLECGIENWILDRLEGKPVSLYQSMWRHGSFCRKFVLLVERIVDAGMVTDEWEGIELLNEVEDYFKQNRYRLFLVDGDFNDELEHGVLRYAQIDAYGNYPKERHANFKKFLGC